MSASVWSLIDPLVRLCGTDPIDPAQVPQDLLTALGELPDPRKRRGVRHGFTTILGLAVCAVLAGARSFTAIAEWSADLPPHRPDQARDRTPYTVRDHDPPGPSTPRS